MLLVASRYRLLGCAANIVLLTSALPAQRVVHPLSPSVADIGQPAPGIGQRVPGSGYRVPGIGQRADTGVPGSELTVYLMTMGPGDEVWEKFGHNAIWIHDSVRNTDIAYNWGLFDFDAADFFPRFLRGDMRYWMGGFDKEGTLDFYRRANRSVWAQELNLTPAQRLSLNRFVEWNALPENRYYDYDYFRDNCSTRVRDVLDRALAGVIQRATERAPSGSTYRSHTRRLTQDVPWVYLGTLLGLGHPVDRPVSRWEEMFLPVRLHDDILGIRVTDAAGGSVPLVKSDTALFVSSRGPEPLEPAAHIGAYLVAGMLVLLVSLLLRHVAGGGSNGARLSLLIVTGLWSFVAGILGTALAALWAFTNHVYSYQNENLLQANPLSLVLAIMILASIRKRAPAAVGEGVVGSRTSSMGWLIAGVSLAGFALKILPAFHQVNGEIIALMLPAHLGIALALGKSLPWRGGGKLRETPATES